ncbi:hypothetical protein D3C76_879300 [compost metagenome]
MVQGNQPGPVGACFEQGLVPEFGLRPSVGEYQATGAGIDLPADLVEHLQAHVPGPGEALDGRWQQRIDQQRLVLPALHQQAALWQQYIPRMLEVAEGGGQAPGGQARVPAAQARQGQLQLHPALVAQQFVPFVHHHQAQRGEVFAGLCPGQQQRQAFRRRHQYAGQAPCLPGAFGTAGIAAAYAHVPRQAKLVQWRLQGAGSVGGQGPHRRDPQHLQRRSLAPLALLALCLERAQCGEPYRIGLAGAGTGMQQAGLATCHGGPDTALERERLPATLGEPGLGEVGGSGHEA